MSLPNPHSASGSDNIQGQFCLIRCEVDEADPLEQASPVPDVVVERNEEFYDQTYVNEKEHAASEVWALLHWWTTREHFNWWKWLTAACVLQSVYKWRIDLSKSEKYWDGWFRGTSNLFLACNLPKLLLLAGGFLTNYYAQLLVLKVTTEFCALLHLREKESTG